jgi:hypothetical protein
LRDGKAGFVGLLPISVLLSIFLVGSDNLFARAEFRGRLDLNYLNTTVEGLTNEKFDQNLELSVQDKLFVKNQLSINYFLERFTGNFQPDDIIRQRWRGNLVGRYYAFNGEYTPRYRLTGFSGESARYTTGRRFNLVLSPPKVPTTRMTYNWSRRTAGEGATLLEEINLDRFASTGFTYKFTNYGALFRDRKTEEELTGNITRRIRDFNGTAGISRSLPGNVSLMADYDYHYSEGEGDTQFEGRSVANNLSARASVKPANWMSVFSSFLGNNIRRKNDIERRSTHTEIAAGLRLLPTDYLRISGSRDYRLIREGGERTVSDYVRAEVVLQGWIRDRMEGRVAVNRTFVILNREGSFPSQGYLFSLDSELYPGVSLNSDFNIIQSENPDQTSERFQTRRTVDLRTIPTRRIMLDFNLRTLSYGITVPWLDTQLLEYGFDVNYQPTSQLGIILTFLREEDRRVIDRKDFVFVSTLNYSFRGGSNISMIYNRRSNVEEVEEEEVQGTTSFSSAMEGILLQITLKLKSRADLRLSFDTRRITKGDRIENYGVNFVKWF